MKNKEKGKSQKKLSLGKQTIVKLNKPQMTHIQGGYGVNTTGLIIRKLGELLTWK